MAVTSQGKALTGTTASLQGNRNFGEKRGADRRWLHCHLFPPGPPVLVVGSMVTGGCSGCGAQQGEAGELGCGSQALNAPAHLVRCVPRMGSRRVFIVNDDLF